MIVSQALGKRLAAAWIALALAVLGLGHNHAPVHPSDPVLAAYLQAGGSLEDLCLSEAGGKADASYEHCPVCAIAKATTLPSSQALVVQIAVADALFFAPAARHLAKAHVPRAPPARGPPSPLV